MARIVIGEGLWANIRGYLNSMFEELYAAIGTGTLKLYTKFDSLTGGPLPTRITTTLDVKPRNIMIFDSEGNEITSTLLIKRLWANNYWVFDIWSSEDYTNVEINISY